MPNHFGTIIIFQLRQALLGLLNSALLLACQTLNTLFAPTHINYLGGSDNVSDLPSQSPVAQNY